MLIYQLPFSLTFVATDRSTESVRYHSRIRLSNFHMMSNLKANSLQILGMTILEHTSKSISAVK